MRRWQMLLVAVCTLLGATASAAQEPARLALLIGNQGYAGKIQPLQNPVNDIKTVSKALEAVGFKVTLLPDAGRLSLSHPRPIFPRAGPSRRRRLC